MSFTDTVQRKIAARRTGVSPRALAQAAREERLRERLAPVIGALEAMRDRLCEDALFADVIGRPELGVEPWDDEAGGTLKLEGRLAWLSITAGTTTGSLAFRIYPNWRIVDKSNGALQDYSPHSGIKGRAADLPAFTAAVEDHIADFLADLAVSPAAELLQSQSAVAAAKDFSALTRY